jgi:hypothetical protein
MFARILRVRSANGEERRIHSCRKKEVLPIMQKQEGFLEILPLVPEIKTEKVLAVTL